MSKSVDSRISDKIDITVDNNLYENKQTQPQIMLPSRLICVFAT